MRCVPEASQTIHVLRWQCRRQSHRRQRRHRRRRHHKSPIVISGRPHFLLQSPWDTPDTTSSNSTTSSSNNDDDASRSISIVNLLRQRPTTSFKTSPRRLDDEFLVGRFGTDRVLRRHQENNKSPGEKTQMTRRRTNDNEGEDGLMDDTETMKCRWKKVPYPVTSGCFCSC